mmetsp:Transcript_116182/g.369714  ORF Transcript_116182/g.369714 Transcript_116182/m.369714 type:complete len:210 (-) Transcript_116182:27-656(-)
MAREVALLAELLRIARIKHPGGRFATHSASEAEVADLHTTILVDQAVRRLQVTVPDARRVEVIEADEQVVEQTRDVQVLQVHLGAAQLLEVRVADLEDDVDLIEILQVARHHDVVQSYDVRVVQLGEDGNLPEDPLGIDEVIQQVLGLLNGDLSLRLMVFCLGHASVGAGAENCPHLVARRHFPGLKCLACLMATFRFVSWSFASATHP